jgi:hypothetical protein
MDDVQNCGSCINTLLSQSYTFYLFFQDILIYFFPICTYVTLFQNNLLCEFLIFQRVKLTDGLFQVDP